MAVRLQKWLRPFDIEEVRTALSFSPLMMSTQTLLGVAGSRRNDGQTSLLDTLVRGSFSRKQLDAALNFFFPSVNADTR